MEDFNNPISFVAESDRQLLDAYSSTITRVVKGASQSVVHITVLKKVQDPRTRKMTEQPGLGSGFVISSDGYIVTNNHVIENAISITVAFADGLELKADLIGADPSTDIAVLKVYGGDLKALQFANSDELEAGLARLDVVPRAEFDLQTEVLRKTREKLEALEKRVAEFEARFPPPS